MKSMISLFAICLLAAGSASAALGIAALESAMANPARPAEDKARDASRQGPQVLSFFGLEAGMTVLDVNASAGWYTEVLSYATGPSGKVYMQNRAGARPGEDAAARDARVAREAARAARATRLGNVQELDDMGTLPAASIDFAITAMNLHDFHNSDPAVAQGILGQVFAALKSGGILGVEDHEGTKGADNATLHRIAYDDAVAAVTAAGFVLEGSSEVLHNDDDDHTAAPFDPALGRDTDRIVLKFVKP